MRQIAAVPLLPHNLQKDALNRNHNAPTLDHLGAEKTLERLHRDIFEIKYGQRC